jgi:LacI family transcriptional regulator
LDYKPSYIARAIRTRRTKTIAIVVQSLKEPGYEEIVQGIEEGLSRDNYGLQLFNARQNIDIENNILDTIKYRVIDGILISPVFGGRKDYNLIEKIKELQIPTIFFNRFITDTEVPYVSIDDYHGGKIAAEYLISKGHKIISILSYDTNINIFNQRVKGFIDTLKKYSLKLKFKIEINTGIRNIRQEIEKKSKLLLEGDSTAVFATTDMIAIHLLSFLTEKQKIVPEDISIVGFDNIYFSSLTNPSLTTIDHNLYELGLIAADNIIYKLEKGTYKKRSVTLKPNLVERKTVKHINI